MNLPMHSSNSVSNPEMAVESSIIRRLRLREYWELTKPRLSFLSVITAIVGYLVANPVRDGGTLIALIIGTAFAAGGAGALNQWLERKVDARMARTKHRPIPSGQVSAQGACIYGLLLSGIGCWVITQGTNSLAGSLTVLTLGSYLWVYTPLKRVTSWSTQIGAIPGALPPLMGWAAARGELNTLGWILFAILFTWQIPHFMAIAWTYRQDYAEGGMPMLSVIEPSGNRAARQAIFYCVLLLGISLLPVYLGYTTWFYGTCALGAGIYFLYRALIFSKSAQRDLPARKLFFASIFYLPLVLAILVLDRWLLI